MREARDRLAGRDSGATRSPLAGEDATDDTWSFKDASPKSRNLLTHSYHPYPARFIPQLAARLIKEYSGPGDLVYDPFCGSGTALVEGLVASRRVVGGDANGIAVLISRAKTSAFEPSELHSMVRSFLERLDLPSDTPIAPQRVPHPRLLRWFSEDNLAVLACLKAAVDRVRDARFRRFLRCALSAILKRCSYWPSYSVRSLRRPGEAFERPLPALKRQCKAMERGNAELYKALSCNPHQALSATVRLRDARTTHEPSVDLVVTSPPYCTSYNYAELHQLSAFWMGRVRRLSSWSRRFIGCVPAGRYERDSLPAEATLVLDRLAETDRSRAARVSRYWQDMRKAYERMFVSLRPGGAACVVIGDTRHRGVNIPNTAITGALLSQAGFEVEREILRGVPNKSLPQSRDPKTGRFVANGPCRASYATESILVARRPGRSKRGASQ